MFIWQINLRDDSAHLKFVIADNSQVWGRSIDSDTIISFARAKTNNFTNFVLEITK